MAILTGYPELEITVEVDGQRAQEYDAPADEVEARAKEIDFHSITHVPIQESGSPFTIKYIESMPGKPFVFKSDSTKFSIPSHDGQKHKAEYQCFLDGIPTGYYSLPGGTKTTRDSSLSGNNESGSKLHRFQFSTLELGNINNFNSSLREIALHEVTVSLCRTGSHLLQWKEELRHEEIGQSNLAHFRSSYGMLLTQVEHQY